MNPEIFSIGSLSIRWYSVLILTGIIVAILLAEKESKKFKFEKDFIFDLAFWITIFKIIQISIKIQFVVIPTNSIRRKNTMCWNHNTLCFYL